MRVLITGSQGFLGRYLTAYWLEAEPEGEVLGIGRSQCFKDQFTSTVHWNGQTLRSPLTEPLRKTLNTTRYRYESISLNDRQPLTELFQNFRPEVVVHLASALRGDEPKSLFETNVLGSLTLLESIAASGIEKPLVVLGSTGFLYGNRPEAELPRREDSPLAPIDLYAVSKQSSEAAARLSTSQKEIPAVWARIFNPVGPGQDERHFCAWVAMQVASIVTGEREPIIEIGPLDSTRDFIDARDTAAALFILAQHGEPGQIYNVASGVEISVREIFNQLLTLAKIEDLVRIRHLPPRPTDVLRHYADISKITELGYVSEYSLNQSLEDLLEYYITTVARVAR